MKQRKAFALLLADKEEYHLEENEDYVLLYAEFADFLFVDYLLVNPRTRGEGVGTQLLEALKTKRKPILLEVEPQDPADANTIKRQRFYDHNGFEKIEALTYIRNREKYAFEMEILYWSPEPLSAEQVEGYMKKIMDEIHNFYAKTNDSGQVEDPDKAVVLKTPR